MMHRRLRAKTAMPIGHQWGNTGERGVAGCLVWERDTDAVKTYKTNAKPSCLKNPSVKFEQDLDKLYSTRINGDLQVQRPASGTVFEKDTGYYCTTTSKNKKLDGNLLIEDPIFLEDKAVAAVKEYTRKETPLGDTVSKNLQGLPPRPPSQSKKKSASSNHRRPRTVVTGPDKNLKIYRPNTPQNYRGALKRSRSATDLWYESVDKALELKDDYDYYTDTYDRHMPTYRYGGSRNENLRTNSRGKHFHAWRRPSTPASYRSDNYDLENDLEHKYSSRSNQYDLENNLEHKYWQLARFRDSAKPRVDTRWSKKPERPESRVNVDFDCPVDSSMTVNVNVQRAKVY